jgi:uncharacterized protein
MIQLSSVNWKALGFLMLFIASHNSNCAADPLITFPIIVNDIKIRVEIAKTPEARALGLMERQFLAQDRGMIFVFPKEQIISMWMKNTPIDLTVVFANEEGRVINIEHMTRNTLKSYSSSAPAKFALEVSKHSPLTDSVKTGDLILGLEGVPKATQ